MEDQVKSLCDCRELIHLLPQLPLLRRAKHALPNSSSQHLSYGKDWYVPQLTHFLGLFASGTKASNVISLDPSLDILRIVDQARVDNWRR
jgi:hypothetical protein